MSADKGRAEVGLTLNGEVTLEALATALTAWSKLLDAIAEDVGAPDITWRITGLSLDNDEQRHD